MDRAVNPGQTVGLNRRRVIELIFGIIGLGLMSGALQADQAWFDRHFLPVFFLSRRSQVIGQTGARESSWAPLVCLSR